MKIDERTSQMLTLLVQANTPMTGNELADKLAISTTYKKDGTK